LYQSSGLYGNNPLVLPRKSSKQEVVAAPAPASALNGGSVARAVATEPSVRRAALVCLPLMAVQQLSGISNLFSFSAAVVRANGFDDDATAQVVLALGVTHAASTLLSGALMDRP